MANSITIQTLVDGPRNVVVKFEGVIDTADVEATGSLTSGATTTGSPVITFASSTAPVQGQYLTGTGIPASTYIKSVDSATQATLSQNATATNTGLTFTLVAGAIVVADPAILDYINDSWKTRASKVRINKIVHNIEDTISVNLFWEATTNVRIEELTGRGKGDYRHFGGLQNNAGTGVTGRIVATTQGWSASGVLSFSIILEMVKQ
ncbi:MAG: hypothetical protein KGL39_10010 [Patescibacteria group bacterium]|nr:hypothetical protein [Patescibacteria group bacterium]